MSLKKRIIPCLDVKNGRTVKGVNFKSLRDAGDAIELAVRYAEEGADELVFLDITATQENRRTLISLTERIARNINIPFTIGGGIRTVADASRILEAGADKISINSAAVVRPNLVDEIAREFGQQFLVVAMDVSKTGKNYALYTRGGTYNTGIDAYHWMHKMADRGAGELLLTSMDADGTKKGFDLEVTEYAATQLSIPVIASGGAGSMQHFADVFLKSKADAALAASLFHYKELEIPTLKQFLTQQKIPVRC